MVKYESTLSLKSNKLHRSCNIILFLFNSNDILCFSFYYQFKHAFQDMSVDSIFLVVVGTLHVIWRFSDYAIVQLSFEDRQNCQRVLLPEQMGVYQDIHFVFILQHKQNSQIWTWVSFHFGVIVPCNIWKFVKPFV